MFFMDTSALDGNGAAERQTYRPRALMASHPDSWALPRASVACLL